MRAKLFVVFALSVSFIGFGFSLSKNTRPEVGEKPSDSMTPSAPKGPVPRNEKEADLNPPERGLPTGAEVYDVMKIEVDPKTGQKHLVPVDKTPDNKKDPKKKN